MVDELSPPDLEQALTRRNFLRSTTLAGAGLLLGGLATAQTTSTTLPAQSSSSAQLKVGIIGVGRQGYNLLNQALRIPGVQFLAVADIWPFRARRAQAVLAKFKQSATVYPDHQELINARLGLDAVIIATPDWSHSQITCECLAAGMHVYCEKEMSNSLEGAAAMVRAARGSGKLLQIGHQRRSEPRYQHALKLIENDKILGRIVRCEGQWARPAMVPERWPKNEELPAATLARYGYDSMEQLVNWHWYRKYSGGPICDLGSHQIDVYNWFLRARPTAVMACGGNDYYPGHEWYDNVMALYEYKLSTGTARASYLLSNSNGHGDFWELFRGDEGTLQISEDERIGNFWKEPVSKKREWEEHSEKTEVAGKEAYTIKIGETLDPSGRRKPEAEKLIAEAAKPGWQLHLENFFAAVRDGGKTTLHCPGEIGYETCVTVMKVNEALEKQTRLEFTPEEFVVT